MKGNIIIVVGGIIALILQLVLFPVAFEMMFTLNDSPYLSESDRNVLGLVPSLASTMMTFTIIGTVLVVIVWGFGVRNSL